MIGVIIHTLGSSFALYTADLFNAQPHISSFSSTTGVIPNFRAGVSLLGVVQNTKEGKFELKLPI